MSWKSACPQITRPYLSHSEHLLLSGICQVLTSPRLKSSEELCQSLRQLQHRIQRLRTYMIFVIVAPQTMPASVATEDTTGTEKPYSQQQELFMMGHHYWSLNDAPPLVFMMDHYWSLCGTSTALYDAPILVFMMHQYWYL